MKKRVRGKTKKGRRANKEALTFTENPVYGEYATQSPVMGALHPVGPTTTLDCQAIGKWVSPQFKKENVPVVKRAKQKGTHYDCCRTNKKSGGSIIRPYRLRSSTKCQNGNFLNGEIANCRKEKSEDSAGIVDQANSQVDAIFHELQEQNSFDFFQQGNLGFETPELTFDSKTTVRRRKAHNLFSGSTPTWNKSVTVLAEDTP